MSEDRPTVTATQHQADDMPPGDWFAQHPLPGPSVPVYRDLYPPRRPFAERAAVVLLCMVMTAMLVVLAGLTLLLAQQTGVTTWPRPVPHAKIHHHHHRR